MASGPEGTGIDEVQPRRWTTSGLLAAEARALTLAESLRATQTPTADPEWVHKCIDDGTLTTEQTAMVHSLTAPGGRCLW